MFNVELGSKEKKASDFPKLMKHIQTDMICLIFYRNTDSSIPGLNSNGLVLEPGSSRYDKGYLSSWTLQNFKDYDGKVTLEND